MTSSSDIFLTGEGVGAIGVLRPSIKSSGRVYEMTQRQLGLGRSPPRPLLPGKFENFPALVVTSSSDTSAGLRLRWTTLGVSGFNRQSRLHELDSH